MFSTCFKNERFKSLTRTQKGPKNGPSCPFIELERIHTVKKEEKNAPRLCFLVISLSLALLSHYLKHVGANTNVSITVIPYVWDGSTLSYDSEHICVWICVILCKSSLKAWRIKKKYQTKFEEMFQKILRNFLVKVLLILSPKSDQSVCSLSSCEPWTLAFSFYIVGPKDQCVCSLSFWDYMAGPKSNHFWIFSRFKMLPKTPHRKSRTVWATPLGTATIIKVQPKAGPRTM